MDSCACITVSNYALISVNEDDGLYKSRVDLYRLIETNNSVIMIARDSFTP